jgi:hypothetical protein
MAAKRKKGVDESLTSALARLLDKTILPDLTPGPGVRGQPGREVACTSAPRSVEVPHPLQENKNTGKVVLRVSA